MTRLRLLILFSVCPMLAGWGVLEVRNRHVEQGNASMKAGKPAEALQHYDRALAELPTERAVNFDRGTALAALGRHDEAVQEFLRASEARATPLKAAAFYNLGNAFFKLEKFGEAAEAYKRSLNLDPGNLQAKWNLELALRNKKKQDEKNQQQKQNGDKNQPQQDPNQPEGKDQQQPPPEPPKDEKQPEPSPSEKPQPEEKGKPPAGGDKGAELREMDAILDNLEKNPKDLEQVKARLRALRRQPPEKDW
jgi:Ca-activated chloride channel homolog